MKVIHVVRDLDASSGGPSRSVPALAEHQSRQPGLEVHVVFEHRGNPVASLVAGNVGYLDISGNKSRRMYSGFFLSSQSIHDRNAIVHLHGLWSPILHKAATLVRKQAIPYVASPRGMLANWAMGHKALKKRIGWRLYQKRDLADAACLIASSDFEKADISSLLPNSKVVVIPNGCEERPEVINEHEAFPGGADVRWALAIGRLHPVKGYAELIESWAAVNPSAWKLAIAGPDEAGYRAVLERQIRNHALADSVFLLGAVGDEEKWSLLDQCELFVAPSRTENFGMAIAEALQSGTPVITTTGTPWRELIERDCGWWVAPGAAALQQALKEATQTDVKALRQKGENGHRLIAENYSWSQVAARTVDLYRSILAGRE